jgi:hypothetical protein
MAEQPRRSPVLAGWIAAGTLILPLALPLPAQSQAIGTGIDAELLETLMQPLQHCIARIEPSQLQLLERQGQAAEREVRALCRAGHRDAAEQRARALAAEMARNPALQALKVCLAELPQALQGFAQSAAALPASGLPAGTENRPEDDPRPVCERLR